jgi:hypothetical protein
MTVSVEQTRLIENALVHVPGALEDMLELELFNTLDEFFKDSRCWLQEISVTTAVDDYDYTLTPTANTGTIVSLMHVLTAADTPVSATMPSPPVLLLRYAPAQVETLTATVALSVVEPLDADGYPNIPSWLMKKWGDGILSGLIGRMMIHPAKPYTNERMAIYHTRKFRGFIAKARAEARHQNLYGAQTWRFPQFA